MTHNQTQLKIAIENMDVDKKLYFELMLELEEFREKVKLGLLVEK